MPKIERFEDVQAWQEARELTKRLYGYTESGRWSKDFALRDQIRRAAIFVMSNIAEGFDRRTDAEFARFLSMAKGSASEVKAQLYVALDQEYLGRPQFDETYEMADKICRYLGSFIQYLLRQNNAKRATHDTKTSLDARRVTHDRLSTPDA